MQSLDRKHLQHGGRFAVAAFSALMAFSFLAPDASRAASRPGFLATAAARPVPGGTVNATVHFFAQRPTDRRVGLRAIITGTQPGASLRILVSRSSCRTLRSGGLSSAQRVLGVNANDGGQALVGIPTQPRAIKTTRDLIQYATAIVATIGDNGNELLACAPMQKLRRALSRARPTVIVGTLYGSTDGGMRVAGMIQMNMQAMGAANLTALLTGLDAGSYRLSIGGCPASGGLGLAADGDINPFNIDVDEVIAGRRVTLDRRTARAIARSDTPFGLSFAEAGPADYLACSRGVPIGKLLGVNY